MSFHKIITFISSFFCFLLLNLAHAYIPHSYFILNKMTEGKPKDTKILLQSQLRFFDGSEKAVETFTEELEVNSENSSFVLRLFDASGNLVLTRDLSLLGQGDNISPTLYLIFSQNGMDLSQSLIQKKVPIVLEKTLEKHDKEKDRRLLEKTSLQKLDQDYAWVIGEKDPQVGPSLWVLKDQFRALQLSFLLKKEPWVIRYKDYQPLGGISYPTKISVMSENKQIMTLEVLGTKRLTKLNSTRKNEWDLPSSKREWIQKYIDILR